MFMTSESAGKILDHALSLGADFGELYIEKTNNQRLSIKNKQVHTLTGGIDFGIGVRLIYGDEVLYGYLNSIKDKEVMSVMNQLASNYKKQKTHTLSELELMTFNSQKMATKPISDLALLDEKVGYLKKISQLSLDSSEKISVAEAGVFQNNQQIEIFNTEGLHVTDDRHYCRLTSNVIAEDGAEKSTGFFGPGMLQGWEISDRYFPEQMSEMVVKQALVKLGAAPCPGGKMPVVIGNAFGGVIFHEACGHLLETTSVQKKSSVFWDKMDQMIASPVVNAVDDGTIQNEWGSINVDDEGMAVQRTQLIKDGKLVAFLSDKVGEFKTGHQRTGSGRRESYRYAPASRMRNTFIDKGNSSLEEMIESIDHGIYCKHMGGGSVQPGTGEFNFAANESYLIEKGKITTPLKASTLIGTGPEVLKKISMVGDDLELMAGMCGSVSGSVPVTVGQPALKVDEILVGGQK
jgi:TldD protein